MMTFLRIPLALVALTLYVNSVQAQELGVSDEELFYPIINSQDNYLPQADESPFLPDGSINPNANQGYKSAPYAEPQMPAQPLQLMPEGTQDKGSVSIPVKALPRTGGDVQKHQAQPVMPSKQINLMEQQKNSGSLTQQPLQPMQPMAATESAQPQESAVEEEVDAGAFVKDDVASYGILADEEGFGVDLWQSVSRDQASDFLELVTDKGVQSPTARRLALRMLLTKADEPKGDSEINWLSERVNVLHKLGMVQAAKALLEGSGVKSLGLENFDGMPKLWVENALLAGNYEPACQYVRGHLLNTDDTFWRRALLTCQAVQGDERGLALSLDILNESEKRDDPLLFNLLHAVVDKAETPRLAPNVKFSPLQALVYVEYPRLITPDVVFRLPDTLLRKLMKDNSLAITYRLQAAERLVDDYAEEEDVKILSQLYDVIEFDESLVKSPSVIEQAQSEVDGSMARALLWQAVRYTELPSTKALTLRTLWQRAERDGLKNLPGSLVPRMRGIQAESNLAWFSPYVIRATLRSGNLTQAKQWWMTLKNNKSLSRDLSLKRTDLAVAFSLLDGELKEDTLDAWWQVKQKYAGQNLHSVERVLALLEASELAVPASMWTQLHHMASDAFADQGKGPGPMWLRLLGTALEKKQAGASLLLLLEPLLYAQAVEMSPQGIANIVTGLRFLGLDDDATSLVLEALLHGA